MSVITMYSTVTCPWCAHAEQLLNKKGFSVQRLRVDLQPEGMEKMFALTGKRSVPQIFIGQHYVGGYDNLAELDHQGRLDPLLAENLDDSARLLPLAGTV